ncbi:MAG TPA: hypothetical protein ENK57_05045 [Polyangiaceae bacterium]|nr:hypothetical protein [Polyangiaceae bacterium]
MSVFRWGAILGCYAYRAVTSAVVALPLGLLVGGVIGAHPRGDEALWEPGGYWLLEVARLAQPGMRAALVQGGVVMLLACFGWLVPLGALIASQAPSRPPARACLKRAAEKLGSLALILGVFLVVQAGAAFGLGVLGRAVGGNGTRTSDVLGLVVPLSTLVVWWLLGVLHDALRVVTIQRTLPWWEAFNTAWELLRRRPMGALGAAGWRTLAGVAVVVAVEAMALAMSGVGGSLELVVLIHQVGIFLIVVLRASWLGWLNGELLAMPRQRSESPAETGARDGSEGESTEAGAPVADGAA